MKGFFTRKRIIAGAIVLAVALVSAAGIYAVWTWDKIKNDPMSLFGNQAFPLESATHASGQNAASNSVSTSCAPGGSPLPSDSQSLEDQLQTQQDSSFAKNSDILNILLIGTDYADERMSDPTYAKHGKVQFNSDVMIVLAIDLKQHKVTMISCPRDTYANIVGAPGIYKLNSALSRGGGMNNKGYMNVCKSVQYLLDDSGKLVPPINFYISGSIPAVKKLVDEVAPKGIYFDVDFEFQIDGRHYTPGWQWLNGQGVVDYSRVREDAGTGYMDTSLKGDLNRTDRQRKILIATFQQLQKDASWLNVPKILISLPGMVSTNLTLPEIVYLTLWAKNLPSGSIDSERMPGAISKPPHAISSNQYFLGWTFTLVNQTQRVQLIQKVYGVTVQPEYKYDANYAKLLWYYMEGEGWIKSLNDVLAKDAKLKDAAKLTPEQVDQINGAITHTKAVMGKYYSLLYKNGKPVVSSGEVGDLQEAVYSLHDPGNEGGKLVYDTVTDDIFFMTGYNKTVKWFSHIYIPPQNP